MKIAVCFLYMLLNMIYLTFGESTRVWGGVNIITHMAFIAFLSYWLSLSVKQEVEQLFFQYIKYLSIAECFYILACIIKGKSWSIYNTDIFAYIIGVGFITFLIHCATMGSERDQT